jgi:ABC-2 type transport system permease protein
MRRSKDREMLTLIKNEVFKLRSSRAPWVTLVIQLALVVAGMSGMALAELDFRDPGAARILITHAGLTSLCVLVLSLMAVAGEYRDGTIVDTFLGTPKRWRVIAAKLVTYTGLGAVYGLLTFLVAWAVAAAWFAAKDVPFSLANDGTWQTLLGAALWMPLFAAVGVSLGAVVRNLSVAVAIALAWIALVEGIAMNLLGDLGRWLPLAAGMALDNAPRADLLSQAAGGLVLAAYSVVLAATAVFVTSRSDVA